MRAFKAFESTFSPSSKSIARLVLPSRLELNRPAGSGSEAPLAKVSFTAFLYDSPVQMIPSCDQTGVAHFHSSTTSASASLIKPRSRESISPRQSRSSAILSSMSLEGDSELFDALLFISSPAAPLDGVRQHEQVEPGEHEEGKRKQRRIGDPGRSE